MKTKEEIIDFIYTMNLQNLTEKISFDRAFKTGIETAVEELIELNLLTIPDVGNWLRFEDSKPNIGQEYLLVWVTYLGMVRFLTD